jgi:hypothetical protein
MNELLGIIHVSPLRGGAANALHWGGDFSTRPLVPRGLGRNDDLVENGGKRTTLTPLTPLTTLRKTAIKKIFVLLSYYYFWI